MKSKVKRVYTHFRHDGPCEFHVSDEQELTIKTIKRPFKLNAHLLWRLSAIWGGTNLVYGLYRGDKLLSQAEVATWNPQLWFMPWKGIHLGPCVTVKDEKGKGYYPYLLSRIISQQPNRSYFMIIHETNVSSVRGVEKIDFKRWARGGKNQFGIFIKTGGVPLDGIPTDEI